MTSRLSFNVIDTHDFKTLGIVDTSWYNPDIVIETPTIEIFPPGYAYSASPYFMTKALNIYNSNGVGITKASCEEELIDLPDGLWKIRYSICPNDMLYIERFFLKTDKFQCKFTQAFLNLDLSNLNDEGQKNRKAILEETERYLQGAIAASNNQNAKLSSDLYKKAENILDKYIQKYIRGLCTC